MFLMNYVQMKLGILFCIWLRITPQHIIFKALSIAQRFIVVRLLFPVQGITALYEQKYTSFKLVRGIGNQLSG